MHTQNGAENNICPADYKGLLHLYNFFCCCMPNERYVQMVVTDSFEIVQL